MLSMMDGVGWQNAQELGERKRPGRPAAHEQSGGDSVAMVSEAHMTAVVGESDVVWAGLGWAGPGRWLSLVTMACVMLI